MKKAFALAIMTAVIFCGGVSFAEEAGEVEELKKRVERLEEAMGGDDAAAEPEHRLHPVHSVFGVRISLGLTLTAQGFENSKGGEEGGSLALSGDLAFESPVGKGGSAVMVLDFQRGEGLEGLPPLFMSPNGNTTGTNADIESFDNDQVHLTQLYYEHRLDLGGHGLAFTIGQLDPAGYFDTNEFANDERAHFLANAFVNNPALEFGGSDDFYSPGFIARYSPNDRVELTAGVFEGDGDYDDAFDSPFVIAEAGIKLSPYGRPGNYRLYLWNRQGRPDASATANPDDPGLANAENKGIGISLDQTVTDWVSLWMRAGAQAEKVAQFDKFIGGGVHLSGPVPGRPLDHAGFGYGASFMGSDYREFLRSSDPSFKERAEHYMEVYYNFSITGATDGMGFHITPDIQYVINPGGDGDAGSLFIYGMRLQAYF